MLFADAAVLARSRHRGILGLATAVALLLSLPALAGPPFITDDPEPVELHHWEVYAAAQWTAATNAASGTLPHVEVNYGALPGVQLHVIVPAMLNVPSGAAAAYGLGDIEVGAKLRFAKEGKWRPEIGVFPLVELPAGSAQRGLGAGALQVLLPLWVQKTFGPWTTYGGGGLKLSNDSVALAVGWLVQRDLSKVVTVGAEGFFTTPFGGSGAQIQANVGAIVNVSELQHLLVSVGPSFGGGVVAQAYLAYQLTI